MEHTHVFSMCNGIRVFSMYNGVHVQLTINEATSPNSTNLPCQCGFPSSLQHGVKINEIIPEEGSTVQKMLSVVYIDICITLDTGGDISRSSN